MRESYLELLGGLAFSILLVYLLIVVNLQSWLDPFVIIMALPAAGATHSWPANHLHPHNDNSLQRIRLEDTCGFQ
jgi:multidrug efflux pump subunit AcrB